MKLSRDTAIKILVSGLLLGIITDILVRQATLGLNFLLFVSLWTGLCLLAISPQDRAHRLPLTYAGLAMANAGIVFWRATPLVQFWSVIIALASLSLLVATVFVRNYRDIPLAARLPTLIGRFSRTCRSLPIALSDGLSQRKGKQISLNRGVVGAAILAIIFMGLFASADQVFSRSFSWVSDTLESFGDLLEGYNIGRVLTIGFWTVMSMTALFVLLQQLPSKVKSSVLKPTLSRRDADTMLWTLSIIFVIFVILQLRYLFTGGALPDGLTYASYAHRGYGQLLVATLLASVVIKYVVTTLKTVATKHTKMVATALVVLNSIVILSAWKRLSLYEATYGWTMTRFVARLGLVCILLGSIALVAWLWGKLNSRQLYASAWYIVVGVLMTAAVLNPEGIIANKNISERTNRTVTLDTYYLANLSPDAWPAICATAPDLIDTNQREYQGLISDLYQRKPGHNQGLSRHYTSTQRYSQNYADCLTQ